MSLVLTFGAYTFTLDITDLIETHTGFSKQVNAPGIDPVLITLGYQGPEYQLQFIMHSTTEYDNLFNIPAGSIISVSSSSYHEFTSGQNYQLAKKRPSRRGGYVSRWDGQITLIRKWS